MARNLLGVDRPLPDTLDMRRHLLLILLFSSFAFAGTDTAALEKRVAALEAEVAALKDDAKKRELADSARLKAVAKEVNRRRAMRNAADEQPPKELPTAPVSFEFVNSPVSEVARAYAEFSATEVMVNTRLSATLVSASGKEVPPAEAIRTLNEALTHAGVEVVPLSRDVVAFQKAPPPAETK